MKHTIHILTVGLLGLSAAHAALPVVSNVSSSQRAGTKLVDISYDVADADGDALKIRVEISSDGGVNYSVPAFTLTGAIGDAVTPGVGKVITWNAEADWDGEYSDEMRVKVIASDAKGLPGLEWGNEVPAGGFLMGQDGGAEGGGSSRHVNIPWSFWLSKFEITNSQYCDYLNIASSAGEIYRVGSSAMKSVAGKYKGIPGDKDLISLGADVRWNVNKLEPVTGRENHPVIVTWYGALAFSLHYGYDLPTTAEWEKAVRGADNDDENEHLTYPWGNSISGGYANYQGSGHPYGYYETTPVGYYDGSQTPFGPDTANGYNLYDVVGNAAEWTRTSSMSIETYPQEESLTHSSNAYGAENASKTHRGGSSYDSSTYLKIYRQSVYSKNYSNSTGFRVIRREN